MLIPIPMNTETHFEGIVKAEAQQTIRNQFELRRKLKAAIYREIDRFERAYVAKDQTEMALARTQVAAIKRELEETE
jgi:hypothetical protein